MSHVRTQIRNAIAQQLNNLTTTGTRVFISRVYPLESAALPGLIIKTESDQTNDQFASASDGIVKQWCQLQLMVKAYAKGVANLDDVLDQVELEVRIVLANNKTLGGLAKDINWLHTTILLENGGEQPIGCAEMIFTVDYRVTDNAPNISIS
jgi:hypothetical protein